MPIVPVERSMSDMMHMLGLAVTAAGTNDRMLKEQIIRFAACHFTIVGPGPRGVTACQNDPRQAVRCVFPTDPRQGTLMAE